MAELNLEQANVKSVLRIMDVASELRRRRERAAGELNVDDAKAQIREKILATAEVTGEQLTPQEIDAAIDSFYSGLYRFEKPQRSFQYRLAELYIARGKLTRRVLLPILVVFALVVGIKGVGSLRKSQHQANIEQQLSEYPARAKQLHQAALALAKEESARSQANDLLSQVQASHSTQDLNSLAELIKKFEILLTLLRQEYSVRIVNRPDQKSGIDRYYTDERGQRVSGYYLVVEAIDNNGKSVAIEIENKENGVRSTVAIWAERVPKAVYDRIRHDKIADGTLEEVEFARKKQGFTEMTVVLTDELGQSIPREAQIASW